LQQFCAWYFNKPRPADRKFGAADSCALLEWERIMFDLVVTHWFRLFSALIGGSAGLKAAEEARRVADAKAAEEARRAAEAKAAQEARRVADAKAAEETRRAAEAKAAQEARRAAEAKAAEEARRAADAKAADETRRAAEAKAAQEARRHQRIAVNVTLGGLSLFAGTSMSTMARAEWGELSHLGEGLEDFWLATDA
jgi:hypothetical protein